MTLPSPAQERIYPLPAPPSDRRFTLGMIFAVAQILVDHGYPRITAGGDLVALQQALYGFLYATPTRTVEKARGSVGLCVGAPDGSEGACGRPGLTAHMTISGTRIGPSRPPTVRREWRAAIRRVSRAGLCTASRTRRPTTEIRQRLANSAPSAY